MKLFPVVFFITLFSGLYSAFGQERNLSKSEYEKIISQVEEKMKTRSYKLVSISKHPPEEKDSSKVETITNITEFEPPDNWRSSHTRRGPHGVYVSENVSIGGATFYREASRPWIKEGSAEDKATQSSSAKFSGPLKNNESTRYRHLGNAKLNGQKIEVVEIVTERKYDLTNYKFSVTISKKSWINNDGVFIRTHEKSTQDGSKVLMDMVSDYDYAAVIKIEAPIK